jgi:hypothetical protein
VINLFLPDSDTTEVAVFPDLASVQLAREALDKTPEAVGLVLYVELTDGRYAMWSDETIQQATLIAYARSQSNAEINSVAWARRHQTENWDWRALGPTYNWVDDESRSPFFTS